MSSAKSNAGVGGEAVGGEGVWAEGEFLERVAGRFRLLGEPMRLRLLQALMEGEKTVTDLVEATGATQANISRHLQQLHRGGVLARRKEGLHVYYRVADASIFGLCQQVCGGLQREAEAAWKKMGGG